MSEKFNKLAKKIEKSYENKHYTVKESKYIGKATAAKIYREKEGY